MKHVFCVQSHITFLIAREIIVEQSMDRSKILFLTIRNYKHHDLDLYETIDLTEEHYQTFKQSTIQKILNNKKQSKEIDKLLSSILNELFTLYIPIIRLPLFQILATHKNCNLIHIIEEGTTAYSPNRVSLENDSSLKRIGKYFINKLLRSFRYRILFVSHYDLSMFKNNNESIFYSLSEITFPGIKNRKKKIVLKESSQSDDFKPFILEYDTVIVLEGAVEQGNLHLNTFLEGIKIFTEKIKDHNIHIKYHPAQSEENITKIETIIRSSGKKINVIPFEVSFEEVLLNNKNLKVYGFSTSLLLYAKVLGSKPYVFEDLLFEDEKYKAFRKDNDYNLKELIANA